ncbi:hypothetical protein EW145_g411 [Phellinidium pouzarii]|uniref:Uncharacterized protein n=1 Tax=Phellinidium pouzarii TaxID=167371 RepID=A0A4S4LJ00_9AGAM|nr:hypothetical protein EW145_g411 [Phellinidium pouzarii]
MWFSAYSFAFALSRKFLHQPHIISWAASYDACMENNETEPVVSSVALEGRDEAQRHVQPSGASVESAIPPLLVHEDSNNVDKPSVTEEGQSQPRDVSENSESQEASVDSKPVASTPTTTTSTQSYVHPVKRFNAVNINKKFLQKTQSSSSVAGASGSSSASINKQTGVLARPAPQNATSHSRLVTAKLTATPVLSSPGPGWSRPSSVPPPASSPTNASGVPKGSILPTSAPGSHGLAQLAPPPGGKIIHPQTRSIAKTDSLVGTGKPAWRNVRPGAGNADSSAQNDFPTAAEAAAGRLVKLADMKVASDAAEAQKHAMSETADAFRGVHLDPNAHHWDEMEEDNDDFLGGVIEFGDGRQYTIEVNDGGKVDHRGLVSSNLGPGNLVSKEERFVDDFDRSWPRARLEQGSSAVHDVPNAQNDSGRRSRASETSSNFSGHSPASLRDASQSRVLFNERLNRMEPYSTNRPGPGPASTHLPTHGTLLRRNGAEVPGHSTGVRLERDAPPHSGRSQVQVLQKSVHEFPQGHDESQQGSVESRRELEVVETLAHSFGDGVHDPHKGRPDYGPPSVSHSGALPNGRPVGSREPSLSRETINGASSVASSDDHGSKHIFPTRLSQHWTHPSPGHFSHSKDMERQLPPHLVHSRPAAEVDAHRQLEHNAPSEVRPESRIDKTQGSFPLVENAEQPDAVRSKVAASIPPDDPEALRKAYLADSVERAKRRRQQEEEERAKAQERARKKAAELEARIAATKAAEENKKMTDPKTEPQHTSTSDVASEHKTEVSRPTEAEVLNVIEEAVKLAAQPDHVLSPEKTGGHDERDTTSVGPSVGRMSKDSDRLLPPSGAHTQLRRPAFAPASDQADSWRVRARPPILPVRNTKDDISHDSIMATLPAVEAFDLQIDESMEVIDFSDIGRLVGEKTPQKLLSIASNTGEKAEPGSWRRVNNVPNKSHTIAPEGTSGGLAHVEPSTPDTSETRHPWPNAESDSRSFLPNVSKMPSSPHDVVLPSSAPSHFGHPPPSPGIPRFLRTPNSAYREAPLSALDDTMSRIKGVIDGMHTSTTGQGSKGDGKDSSMSSSLLQPSLPSVPNQPTTISGQVKREKWLPPALRHQSAESSHRRTETFESTRPEPPRSPAPPDNKYTIRVPTISRHIEPLTKKQINHAKSLSGFVRWEILSFDPPVEGMTKRNLSVNDVLFRRPPGPFKARKFRIVLPNPKPSRQLAADVQSLQPISGEIVSKAGPSGAFGRPRLTDQSRWRAAPSDPSASGVDTAERPAELDVTSRSPPPDLVPTAQIERPSVTSGVVNGRNFGKNKIAQKLLDGSDVAFYRDTRRQADGNTSVPVVTFTVSSELEGEVDSTPLTRSFNSVEPLKTTHGHALEGTGSEGNATPLAFPAPKQPSSALSSGVGLSQDMSSYQMSPRGTENKLHEQQSDPLLRSHPVTPPPQSTPSTAWKSPARVPDPEHLKAVWSQASDRGSLPTVNSLKSIADDLTSVPFTLQEVKSEGGTPPPSGPIAPPTRMSASEVTRAFQTVPSGPSNPMSSSSLRGSQISSVLGSPMGAHRPLKPTTIGLPPPPSLNPAVQRPHYMGYPPSMSNHSPSPPTLIYSHIMPNGVPNSPAGTPYGQPVWMPLVHQQGPQMVRAQPSSPYSPSLMPYHVPGAQNGMFPPSNGMPSSQGSPASYPSAPPSQMMVSPVLPHAAPVPPHMMYAASPMLVPVPPPGSAPQPRPYPGAVGMGRGSMPAQNHIDSRQHPNPGPPPTPNSRFPVHSPGYTPVPPQSFVRPW